MAPGKVDQRVRPKRWNVPGSLPPPRAVASARHSRQAGGCRSPLQSPSSSGYPARTEDGAVRFSFNTMRSSNFVRSATFVPLAPSAGVGRAHSEQSRRTESPSSIDEEEVHTRSQLRLGFGDRTNANSDIGAGYSYYEQVVVQDKLESVTKVLHDPNR